MNPIKSLVPTAKWLLKIAVVVIIYHKYFDFAAKFDFDSLEYFIALVMVIAAVALIVGGFTKKNQTTVLSGLVICILSVIMMFVDGFDLNSIMEQFAPAALGFYYMARGNEA